MTKTALVTGITGQDGSHLTDFLLNLGYEVHGTIRRTSTPNIERIRHRLDDIVLHEADLCDQSSITRVALKVKPDEIYNLAAQSFVGVSWNQPAVTGEVTGLGAVRVFEAARHLKDEYGEAPRVYQASTSEMFGNAAESPQNEQTAFSPRSPYGAAKLYAHEMARIYRESFDLFITCGILFNHEGPRRGEQFVTRKITKGVARIVHGKQDMIKLGNLEACRDWGYAPEYVRAMHMMLEHNEPRDFVVGTGVMRSIRDFLTAAFGAAGIDDWSKHVEIDPQFYRPAELHTLCADASEIEQVLGWEPVYDFNEWVESMVKADLELEA